MVARTRRRAAAATTGDDLDVLRGQAKVGERLLAERRRQEALVGLRGHGACSGVAGWGGL